MSDAQLDIMIEKLDQIIEHLMLGGVTSEAGLGATPDDRVSRWEFPSGGTRTLEVTKRHGVVIDVKIL